MMTFNQIYTEAQAQAQDTSASTTVLLKRAIHQGMRKFIAVLNREWITTERTFDFTANQQFYQLPEDAIRPKSIVANIGGQNYPLIEVEDEDQWNDLNRRPWTSTIPDYFYVKGNDQIGIYPTPSANTTNGSITLHFERTMRDMSQDDYTTGTVDLPNASAAVTGHGTTFTANMVGRTLFITDGSPDGIGYKIGGFIGATSITLENFYGGSTATGVTFLIGEVPNIPEEFHESLVDYALYRFYRRRKDVASAREMKATFDEALLLCQENYSSKTSSQYVKPIRPRGGYTYQRRDLTITP